MQHAKETCLVAVKGIGFDGLRPEKLNDLIIGWRNIRQSHKPEELYRSIEETFPGGLYLEVFARAHNLRAGWVSLGLELPR
jgi:N6-adenosine-specific RNA methylase IME4